MKSKRIVCIFVGVIGCAGLIVPGHGALTLCQSLSDCSKGSWTYCCPTGQNGTSYTCPDGWFYRSTSGLCERLGSTSTTGSDSTGTYTETYGTCSPQTSTYKCYEGSESGTAYNGTACFKKDTL